VRREEPYVLMDAVATKGRQDLAAAGSVRSPRQLKASPTPTSTQLGSDLASCAAIAYCTTDAKLRGGTAQLLRTIALLAVLHLHAALCTPTYSTALIGAFPVR